MSASYLPGGCPQAPRLWWSSGPVKGSDTPVVLLEMFKGKNRRFVQPDEEGLAP